MMALNTNALTRKNELTASHVIQANRYLLAFVVVSLLVGQMGHPHHHHAGLTGSAGYSGHLFVYLFFSRLPHQTH